MSDPKRPTRRERRARPPRGQRHEQYPPAVPPSMSPSYWNRAFEASGPLPPPPVPERLPWGVNCILARHDPGWLVADLGYARQRLRALTVILGRGTTYHVKWQLEGAREQVYDVAHEVDRVRQQVYIGRCARLRKRDEYSGYISVRDREELGDGGLRTVSGLLNKLADAMKRLRGREPFYVRARDSSLSGARSRITAFTGQIAGALDEIAVDLSATDMSGRTDLDLACLANVIWSARTL